MTSLLRTTPLLVRLALGGLVMGVAALAPTPAMAQSAVFEGSGLIDFVAPTGVLGDGSSAVDMYMLAMNADGSAMTGLRGKPTASSGTCTELVEAGGGLYRFSYTPPRLETGTTVTVTWKGKVGAAKESVSKSVSFPVAAARSRKMTAATNPPQMVLGQDLTASLAVNLAGAQGSGGELAVRASVGSVDNLIALGGGQFSALYSGPTQKYPQVGLITAVDKRDPNGTFSAVAVPMVGKADFPVTVAPNSRVILKVGGREYGPIAADAMGRAMVPIMVPPGAPPATLVQIAPDGKVTEAPLDLKIPETRRIAMFPTATAIPADNRLQLPVRAFVVGPDGKPDDNAQVVFSTTAGVVGSTKNEGGGIYSAIYTPPLAATSTQATVAVNLADRPTLQADSINVNLVATRATKVALTAEPATLGASADGFKVFAKVTGPDGSGLGGRSVSFAAAGARQKEVKDLRNGDYQALFSTTGNGAVEIVATVGAAATGNPLGRVVVVPAKERLPGDGLSTTLVTVLSLDDYGYPVPNQDVSLQLIQGDGVLPSTVKTGPDGVGQVSYTAGRRNGAVQIAATSGDISAGATLIQAPANVGLPDLPIAGQKYAAGIATEWSNTLALLRVEREGASAPVASAPVTAAPVAVAAPRMTLVSDPAQVSPGGTVVLRVNLTDASGRGVGGQQLEFLTSAGTVGQVTDLGGGAYQAVLSVPAGTSGEIKVSAATRDGQMSSFMRVPVGGAEAAWGTNPFSSAPATTSPYATSSPPPATTTAPPATTPPPLSSPPPSTTTVTKTPAPSGDHPWLRARIGYAFTSYSYKQELLAQATVLFPRDLDIGAPAQGFQVAARAWGMKFLGAEAALRFGHYTLEPQPLCNVLDRPCDSAEPVGDSLTDGRVLVDGRYPFDVGSSQMWVGAKVGPSASDVQIYKVLNNTIELQQLTIWSLAVGAEVGADVGDHIFGTAEFVEHLASATTPFNTQFGVNVGYAFGDGSGFAPTVSLGYDFGHRSIEVENSSGGKVGQISDTEHQVNVSVGIQL